MGQSESCGTGCGVCVEATAPVLAPQAAQVVAKSFSTEPQPLLSHAVYVIFFSSVFPNHQGKVEVCRECTLIGCSLRVRGRSQ